MTDAEQVANTFAIEANRCYFTSRYVYLGSRELRNGSGFFAHGAVEQYLKAVICKANPTKLKGVFNLRHNLGKLRELALEVTGDQEFGSEMFHRVVEYFDPFDQVGRYGANANFDPLAVKNENFQSAGVSVWQPDYMPHLDYAVSVCRKHITVDPISMDLVSQVMARNKKSALWQKWQIESLSPDDILFIENDYI